MPFDFGALPVELRVLVGRKTNSATVGSLHRARAGTRPGALTNAKLHLLYRAKLAAKVREWYRRRLRKAFGAALGALQYVLQEDSNQVQLANNLGKLGRRGWTPGHESFRGIDWRIMTLTTGDGYSLKLVPDMTDRFGYITRCCEIYSPLGTEWVLFKNKDNITFSDQMSAENLSDPKRRIELSVAREVLREFGLTRR